MRRLARVLVLLLLALAASAGGAPVAGATPLLDEGDATELAQSLADATEEQGVCYGWDVQVDDQSGGSSGFDAGSSGGPAVPLDAAASLDCTKMVVLEGTIRYTCDSCEAEDSSSISVLSNFRGGPTTSDLKDLGLEGGDLKKDDGDEVLQNMVGALPLIVAAKGIAAPVPVEPTTVTASPSDHATNSPAIPDWLRDRWLALLALLVVAGAGVVFLVEALRGERREATRRRRAELRRKRRDEGRFTTPIPPSDPTP